MAMTVRIGLVPIVRPLFRGARMGLPESSRQSLERLAHELGFVLEYVADPVTDVYEAKARAREIEQRHHEGSLDLVLVEHVTFATGDLIMPFLDLPLALGIWALPEATRCGPLPQNALCGLNLSLSLPTRRTVPVKWFYGHVGDADFRRRLDVTLRAMRGVRVVRKSRLLWVGGPAPGFHRLELLPDLPLRLDRLPLEAAFDTLQSVSPSEIEERLAEYDEPSSIARDDLRAAARLELALERLAKGYDGVALRCWPEVPERAASVPCAAYARLADRGCAFACEGDVVGLVSMLAVGVVTGRPAALLDLSHAAADGLLFWHCGNAARAWAAYGRTTLAPHFNWNLPAVRSMRLVPGPVCGLRFLEGRRAAVYAGTVLDRADGYDGVSGWIGDLRWAGNPLSAAAFLASVLNHRLPHHLIWGLGDAEAALLELCGWLGHDPLPPDPEETSLRWTGRCAWI